MTASSSVSSHLLFVLRSQPPLPSPSSFISFLKPFILPSSNITLRKFHLHPPLQKTLSPSFLSTPPFSSRAFSYTPPLSSFVEGSTSKSIEEDEDEVEDEYDEEGDEFESEREDFEDTKVAVDEIETTSSPLVSKREDRLKLEVPSLSVKERKELGSYAHSLGKKLSTQLVGKSGVTPNLVTAFSDNLEANELLKVMVIYYVFYLRICVLRNVSVFGLVCV